MFDFFTNTHAPDGKSNPITIEGAGGGVFSE